MAQKYSSFSLLQVILAIVIVLVASLGYKNNLVYPTASFGETTYKLEVAKSDSERQKGLSGRTSLENDEGMIFVFDEPGFYSFWMKDMKFDLDIIWLDARGKVVQIYTYVSPYDFPKSYSSDFPASYVLEINGGSADDAGIEYGDYLLIEGV